MRRNNFVFENKLVGTNSFRRTGPPYSRPIKTFSGWDINECSFFRHYQIFGIYLRKLWIGFVVAESGSDTPCNRVQ